MVQPTRTTSSNELLSTKLSLPRLHTPLIKRRSLLTRLDAGLPGDGSAKKLTLLSAPAGFGKTTLAVEWVETLSAGHPNGRMEPPQTAWVSLDSGDNDPVRFWRYLITAIQAFDVEAGRSALARLQISPEPNYEAVLTTLINGLVHRSGMIILILEDYHFITNSQIHTAVGFLLEHLPPALHLMILTRSDPPLPLARLRARNEVNELRAFDLRFSEAERRDFLVNEFARQAAPPDDLRPPLLSMETLARLAERTEGWAAGLRLVALALQGRQDLGAQEQFLETFAGSHRPVLEYLLDDVFASQKEYIQEFLLATSFLHRLTGSLCDAVTGRNDSARILDQLEHANLFLEPLDGAGHWYRFHGLFAEAMRYAASQRLGEPHLRQLAHNASLWYEERAMLSEAVEAALLAQEFARAAELIEDIVAPRLVGNEFHTLLRWLETLPEHVLSAHPRLCMTYTQAILFTSEMGAPVPVDRLQAPLAMAEQAWKAEGKEPRLGEVLAMRALIAVRQGDFPRACAFAGEALARLPERRAPEPGAQESGAQESENEWRGISLIFTGLGMYYAGRIHAAHQSLTEARALCQAAGNIYGVLNATLALAEVHARRAEPRQAAQLYQQALAELECASIERKDELKRLGRVLLGRAELAFQRNDLEAAEQDAAQAVAIGVELRGEELVAHGTWVLARALRARSEIEPARDRLNSLVAQIKQPLLLREVQAWQAWLALSAGDMAAVQRWAAVRAEAGDDLPVLYAEQEALILARVQIAQGKAEAARRQLEHWLSEAEAQGRARSELEIRIVLAQAEAALGRLPQARQTLARGLALAEPESYLRVFLDEGKPLAALLQEVGAGRNEEPTAASARDLLFAMNQEQAGRRPIRTAETAASPISSELREQYGESLSQQEERVLALLAVGLSNPEIARELVVSVNTVKTHVKSIYRKLNVNSRSSARGTARRLKLLL